jgi:hypothetical protein
MQAMQAILYQNSQEATVDDFFFFTQIIIAGFMNTMYRWILNFHRIRTKNVFKYLRIFDLHKSFIKLLKKKLTNLYNHSVD